MSIDWNTKTYLGSKPTIVTIYESWHKGDVLAKEKPFTMDLKAKTGTADRRREMNIYRRVGAIMAVACMHAYIVAYFIFQVAPAYSV